MPVFLPEIQRRSGPGQFSISVHTESYNIKCSSSRLVSKDHIKMLLGNNFILFRVASTGSDLVFYSLPLWYNLFLLVWDLSIPVASLRNWYISNGTLTLGFVWKVCTRRAGLKNANIFAELFRRNWLVPNHSN